MFMSNISKSDVISAIETVLELDSGTLNEESRADEFEEWDSLGILGVLVALDKLFDGKVGKISEMATADSIAKILTALRKNSLITDQ
jgi:acyl carrier protein